MQSPAVRYAKSGDVNIAYSVVGDGPFDVVFVVGWVISTLDFAWYGPPADFFRELASFCRLILFDKRGTGLSDRDVGAADMETRMDDVRAVMDAVGSERAAIMGVSEGGPLTLLFAATYPERTAAAVVYGTGASYVRRDDYPWADTEDEYRRAVDESSAARGLWGTRDLADAALADFAPTFARTVDEETKEWWVRYLRLSASPGAVLNHYRMNIGLDVRDVLPTIRVPTLVCHFRDEKIFRVEEARYIAEHVPGADFLEFPGDDHAWFTPSVREAFVPAVRDFLSRIWKRGEWDVVEADRVLATVLFTDIVGSTEKAVELGDMRWRELVERHHAVIRRQLVRHRGQEVDTAGDGFFASFDGPARAIRCACSIADEVHGLGLEVRAGLHTGECELMNGKVGGIAVHIGARVAAEAPPGAVLVSSTVKDLVAGAGITFRDFGTVELKGIPGGWQLFAVDREGLRGNNAGPGRE